MLQQAILNLINNAIYALTEQDIENPFIRIQTKLHDDSVRISISDNAGGAPEEIIHNVMQPFYSTKPVGKGSGIGLALCYDVVDKMEGTIDCSNGETGFKVTINLPIYQV